LASQQATLILTRLAYVNPNRLFIFRRALFIYILRA